MEKNSTINRAVFLVFLLVVFPFSLMAVNIAAVGRGATAEEAKANARTELASQIQITISSVQRVLIHEYNQNTVDSQFLEDTSLSVDVELLGAVFLQEPEKIGANKAQSYLCRIEINESSLPLYLQKLKDIEQAVSELEAYTSLDTQSRKTQLITLLSEYKKFDAYKYIAMQLGLDPLLIPRLNRTKVGIELEFKDLLKQEEVELKDLLMLSQINDFVKKDSESQQLIATNKILNIQQQLLANRVIQLKLDAEKEQEQKYAMEASEQSIQVLARQMKEQSTVSVDKIGILQGNGSDPFFSIGQIEARKEAFFTVWNQYKTAMEKEEIRINEVLIPEIEKIEQRQWRAGELSFGNPIDSAVEAKSQEIEHLKIASAEKLAVYGQRLEDGLNVQLVTLFEAYREDVNRLESTEFHVNGFSNAMTLDFDTYDGARQAWPMVIQVDVSGEHITLERYLSYTEVTGLPVRDGRVATAKEYEEYLDQVDLFNFLFATEPLSIVNCDSICSIKQTGIPSQYAIEVEHVDIIRLDTMKTVVSYTDLDLCYLYEPNGEKYDLSEAIAKYPKWLERYPLALKLEQQEHRRKNPQLYSRQNITLGVGFGILSLPGAIQDSAVSGIVEIHFALVSSLYGGLCVEGCYSPVGPAYLNFLGQVGFVYPFDFLNNVVKIFADIRLAGSSVESFQLVSKIGTGLEFTWPVTDSISGNISLTGLYQLSGSMAGSYSAYVSIGVGKRL
jgi:hypothetical protein